MLKISCAGCLVPSQTISAQFIFQVRVAAQNRQKNSLKPPILGIQGHPCWHF